MLKISFALCEMHLWDSAGAFVDGIEPWLLSSVDAGMSAGKSESCASWQGKFTPVVPNSIIAGQAIPILQDNERINSKYIMMRLKRRSYQMNLYSGFQACCRAPVCPLKRLLNPIKHQEHGGRRCLLRNQFQRIRVPH